MKIILISADYSQIELRIIAALSGGKHDKSFLNNEDIHKSTASKVFDVPLEEVTRDKAMRKRLISELYMESRRSDSAIKPTCHVKSADLIEAYQSYQD
jgi:DNA polymerase-1